MDVKKAIQKRQSIRKFKDTIISDKLIKEVLDAARMAPSGNNAQPSRFIIVRDKKTKAKLKENDIFVQQEMYKAPVIIVCCGDPDTYPRGKFVKDYDDPEFNRRALRDLSIASGYLVLRAKELGLGTCFVGWIKKEKIKEILGIPKRFVVPYIIVMGYPAEKPAPRGRKKLKEILHWEEW